MSAATEPGRRVGAAAAASAGERLPLASAARAAALAAAGVAVAGFLAVALLRISYPFQLEWLEGESLHYLQRAIAGQTLYPEPSLDFIPFVYTPLYYHLSALVAGVAGASLPTLRLVSLLTALGSLALLFEIARRETGRVAAGVLAAGLFAATYRASGAFLDLARVDSLFLLFSLAGLILAAWGRASASAVAAGVLAAAAWQTKQLAAIVFLPVIVYELWRHRRRGLVLLAATAVAGGASLLAAAAWHGPWYRFYVIDLPASHGLRPRGLVAFWTEDVAATLPIAVVLTVLYLLCPGRGAGRARYGVVAVGLVAAAWVGRLNPGAYDNVRLPLFAALGLGGALGAARAAELLTALSDRALRQRGLVVLQLAIVVQLAALAYDPRPLLPSAADRTAGDQLVARLRALDGPVLLPTDGYLALLAGKPGHAHLMAIQDASGELSVAPSEHAGPLLVELREALRARQFAAVVLDDARLLEEEVVPHYRLAGPVFVSDQVFWPPTGHPFRPSWWYEPAAPPPRPRPGR
ncbi:MAG TPA: glycosyltransferase family 39 protein [Thermoanaerobaculia bacterium]|nr:glycosyltransferase family 39 protein [Thermoanaerobaculia bacterium]